MSATPFLYERAVRFEEVDAAAIVFFGRYLGYCHEAMEAMLAPVDGGYAGLVMTRKIGLPAVRVEADYKAPLRFGDSMQIAVTVEHIGTSSSVFRYEISRILPDRTLGDVVSLIRHIVVLSDLTRLHSTPIPADVRRVLATHHIPPKG